jgi:hypothetical protein
LKGEFEGTIDESEIKLEFVEEDEKIIKDLFKPD